MPVNKTQAKVSALEKRVEELERAVEELLWRLDPTPAPEEPPKPKTKRAKREIPYDRKGTDIKWCPCCGEHTHCGYACSDCWDKYAYTPHNLIVRCTGPGKDGIVAGRDAFYELGVQLRAEGKLPPLRKDWKEPEEEEELPF